MRLPELWRRLGVVRTSRLSVDGEGVVRVGSGTVSVRAPDARTIEWEESGSWRAEGEVLTSYHDHLRWQRDGEQLSLYHLRRGSDHPVHLADLADLGEGRFAPLLPHQCLADTYLAELRCSEAGLTLRWQVQGPRKSYTLTRHLH